MKRSSIHQKHTSQGFVGLLISDKCTAWLTQDCLSLFVGSKSMLVNHFLKFSSSMKCFAISVLRIIEIIISQNHFQSLPLKFPIISSSSLCYIKSKARAIEWFSITDQSLYRIASLFLVLTRNTLLNPGWSISWTIDAMIILSYSKSSRLHFSISWHVTMK